jgi:hypothetical protein
MFSASFHLIYKIRRKNEKTRPGKYWIYPDRIRTQKRSGPLSLKNNTVAGQPGVDGAQLTIP